MRRAPVRRIAALAAAALAAALFALRPRGAAPRVWELGAPAMPRLFSSPAGAANDAPPEPMAELRDAPAEPTEAPASESAAEAGSRAPRGNSASRLSGLGGGGSASSSFKIRPAGVSARRPAQSIPAAAGNSPPPRRDARAAEPAAAASPARVAAARSSARAAAQRFTRPAAPAAAPRVADFRPGARGAGTRPATLARGAGRPGRLGTAAKARTRGREDAFAFDAPRPPKSPARERRREARERRGRGFRPLLLSKLLGARPLQPPPPGLAPPAALDGLAARKAPRDLSGAGAPAASPGLTALDGLDPATLARDRRTDAHWDGGQWHDGAVRGVERDGAWLWLYRDGARWWALAGDPPRGVLRQDGLWWTKERGVWFVVHDGQPWAWRRFQDWDAQGLFHPATGTEMVYSRDFARVAVVTPGEGAEVFDAATGETLTRVPEERMPPRRRPRATAPQSADVFGQSPPGRN